MPRKKEYEVDTVVKKAMHTFWQHGYESTSVRMLEQDMGINQFSIYSSFGNKRDLFLEVLKKYKGHVAATFLKELLNSEGRVADIKKFLLDFGHAICSGKSANGCLMVNTGMEMGQKDPQIAKQIFTYFEFIKNTFVQTLENAKGHGELDINLDTQKKAEFLLGSLQGLSLYAKFREEQEIDDFVATILSSLK